MKNCPLVTIVVPVYNGEQYISECINSIINQDYTNLEIIVIDDGSQDGSKSILEDFARKDDRIRVIIQENAGVSVARNAALDIMKGEYLCLVDQDDCISPNYITYFVDLICNNDAEIAVVPKARRFVGKLKFDDEIVDDEISVIDGQEAAIQMLYYNFIIAPWNKIISTKLIKKNKLRFDKRFFSGEGFLFSVECFQRAKKVAIGHKLVYYYRCDNENSGMTKFNEWVFNSSLEAQEVIRNNIICKEPRIMKACEYALWHTNCDMLSYMVGCNAVDTHYDDYKTILKACKKGAKFAIGAPISKKEKIKALSFAISPRIAIKLINRFRLRKYTSD